MSAEAPIMVGYRIIEPVNSIGKNVAPAIIVTGVGLTASSACVLNGNVTGILCGSREPDLRK
jgi:Na+/H+ antiporter NhaD/arsenite permease-like protein